MVNIYSFIHISQHDLNLTSSIKIDNFLHDQQIRHEISELELKCLTCLIK
jgi:hypothetical protein